MSQIHGYLNSVPSDYGHRWTNNSDNTRAECQYCGDSYGSQRWCDNQLVVSDQDRDMDDAMSQHYGQEDR